MQTFSPSQAMGSVDAKTLNMVRTRFVRNVYTWMAGGLLVTGMAALITVKSDRMMAEIMFNRALFWGLIIAEFGLVVALSAWINRMSVRTASWAFLGYSLLNGVTLSVIFLMYTPSSVAMAFFVSAGVFCAAAIYGTVTKKDLTGAGSFAFMGLIGIIIASIANMFFAVQALDWIISYVGVIVFTVLAAYDAQKIQRIGITAAASGEAALSKSAILGALALYLDFINLFLFMLRIMGDRR